MILSVTTFGFPVLSYTHFIDTPLFLIVRIVQTLFYLALLVGGKAIRGGVQRFCRFLYFFAPLYGFLTSSISTALVLYMASFCSGAAFVGFFGIQPGLLEKHLTNDDFMRWIYVVGLVGRGIGFSISGLFRKRIVMFHDIIAVLLLSEAETRAGLRKRWGNDGETMGRVLVIRIVTCCKILTKYILLNVQTVIGAQLEFCKYCY